MRKTWAVFALLLLPLVAGAQETGESLPKLVSHSDIAYPAIAQTAHVMGDVVVKITTNGESVTDAVAESGPPLLQRVSVDNAKTWKFAPHTPGTFHVTFRYKISDENATTAASFPVAGGVEVQVVARPQTLIVDYASVLLGTWNAELKSPHGKLSKTFEFLFSGPNGEWLSVKVPGTAGDKGEEHPQDDEFSRKDGDFLIFSMKLAEPDGKCLETYLTGKMTGDKIIGTFVDESGVRGTWTATRIPDPRRN
jgi:hypothetical protein